MNSKIDSGASLKLLKWIEFLSKSHYVDQNTELKSLISDSNEGFKCAMDHIRQGASKEEKNRKIGKNYYYYTEVSPQDPKRESVK